MQKLSFNDHWFLNGEVVTLPHDAMIKEKRSKNASDGGHGYFPGGIYTYSKHLLRLMSGKIERYLLNSKGFTGMQRFC